tara:strand:- start:462 stop:614 length:153 start_codon:yes stop_codon:yes gene_type:complete
MIRKKPQELFEEKEYISIEKNDLTKLINQIDKIVEQLKIIVKSLIYTRDS